MGYDPWANIHNPRRVYRSPNRAKRNQKMRMVIKNNPGLTDAFRVARNHRIIRDIRGNFIHWGSLTDKQIALVFKIADQVKNDRNNWVNAPKFAGRVEVVAKVLSIKEEEFWINRWNRSIVYKAMMSVQLAPNRSYKTWGTIPWEVVHNLLENNGNEPLSIDAIKGKTVKFQARFKVSDNDPTMTFYSRPSKFTFVD
jgi:hypothetical protein